MPMSAQSSGASQANQRRRARAAALSYNRLPHHSWLTTDYLSHGSAIFQPHSGKNPEYTLTVPRCLNPGINRQQVGEQLKSLRTPNLNKSLKHIFLALS